MSEKTIRISAAALSEIQAAMKAYCDDVKNSDLSYGSQGMYVDFAECFVRWLQGEFAPGSRKAPFRIKDKATPGPASAAG